MKTLVTFRSSAFNTSEPRDYFINAGCFGEDVAKWVLQELRELGLEPMGEPRQEDFGWYVTFSVERRAHDLLIGYRPGGTDDGQWIAWIERRRGLIGSLVGQRNRGIHRAAVLALHAILCASPKIRDIRWHAAAAFQQGREDSGSEQP